jgi:hypothetical protein
MNDFSKLDAQDEMSRLAQMTPEEQAEYNTYLDQQQAQQEQLVKDNPTVETAFRQAMKDFYGQPYLFDYQLDMTVEEARATIHTLRHLND